MYYSADGAVLEKNPPLLFQEDPLGSHGNNLRFNEKSWTDTIVGYLNESRRFVQCVMANMTLMHRPYTWLVNLNIEQELTPKEICSHRARFSRKMRQSGIVAVSVIEPTWPNRVHYHLLLSSQQSEKELRRIIAESMPTDIPFHSWVERIYNPLWWARYIVKAKAEGILNGRVSKDIHGGKRLLFKPNLGFNKVGYIGEFWIRSRAKLWNEICERESHIADGLELPGVRASAKRTWELVSASVSLRVVERNFGYYAWMEANGE